MYAGAETNSTRTRGAVRPWTDEPRFKLKVQSSKFKGSSKIESSNSAAAEGRDGFGIVALELEASFEL
jgi:hypothetical protein